MWNSCWITDCSGYLKIFQFFVKETLRDQSCNGEELEKAREVSLSDPNVSLHVFTEGMKSPECLHILDNCMKNIKAKIKKFVKWIK